MGYQPSGQPSDRRPPKYAPGAAVQLPKPPMPKVRPESPVPRMVVVNEFGRPVGQKPPPSLYQMALGYLLKAPPEWLWLGGVTLLQVFFPELLLKLNDEILNSISLLIP